MPPRLQPYTIVCDTREQRPYFLNDGPCVVKKLDAGDYSIVGLEAVVAIERKSLQDFWGCLTKGRERFERELARLAAITYPAIVIECTAEELQKPLLYVARGGYKRVSRVPPTVACSSVISWMWRYRVPIWPAGDRKRGEAWTRKMLDNAWRLHQEALKAQRKEIRIATKA